MRGGRPLANRIWRVGRGSIYFKDTRDARRKGREKLKKKLTETSWTSW